MMTGGSCDVVYVYVYSVYGSVCFLDDDVISGQFLSLINRLNFISASSLRRPSSILCIYIFTFLIFGVWTIKNRMQQPYLKEPIDVPDDQALFFIINFILEIQSLMPHCLIGLNVSYYVRIYEQLRLEIKRYISKHIPQTSSFVKLNQIELQKSLSS